EARAKEKHEMMLDMMNPMAAIAASQVKPRSQKPTGPVPRLMITHMELENFKSYAGKISIGPFHKVRRYHHPFGSHMLLQCFSSVVGPNGSGKSNVIDALLFVFGKRANKLRHKKLS